MLDVGCGSATLSTQTFTSYFESTIGIDISEVKIEEAKRLNKCGNVAFELIDGYDFPVEDNSVHLITFATSIHFLDLKLLEKKCERVLKPGGCCAAYAINWGDITGFSVGRTDWRQNRVLLNLIVEDFYVNIKAHLNIFAALRRNQQVYDQILNSSKIKLQEIVREREMTLRQLKNVFRTVGDYVIFMKHEKSTTDPLEFHIYIRILHF
ncbi:putative methyltransferase DDB_G0268948 [Styela clava]